MIRRLLPADVPALARLHLRSWQIAFRGVVPDSYLDRLSIEQYVAMWSRIAADPDSRRVTWIGEWRSRIAGYCAVGPTRERSEPTKTGEVYGIYLAPEFFRHGFGTALLRRGEETLRECGYRHAALWVLVKNRNARDFYEANGWGSSGVTISRSIGREIRYVRSLI